MPRPASDPNLTFSSPSARRQYQWLMFLFRFAVMNRYLYGIFTKWVGYFFPEGGSVSLNLPSGAPFTISLDDAYWTRFALYFTDYEPEVARVLEVCAGHAKTFCDIGANKGYWSVYAAPTYDKVIAIEASSTIFKSLTENTRDLKNVSRRWAAAYRESNKELTFLNVEGSHVSGHLVASSSKDTASERVETVAIDDLLTPGEVAVIKLDVEGAEKDAIAGARRAISEGSIVLYEDHGADKSCAASAAVLSLGGVSVYSLDGTPAQLRDLADVKRSKHDRYKGYNFLAAKDDSKLLEHVLDGFAKH